MKRLFANIAVIAPDPDAFGKASRSIKWEQDQSLKREVVGNLRGT